LDADFRESRKIVPEGNWRRHLHEFLRLPDLIFRLIFSRPACAHHALRAILYDKCTGRPIPGMAVSAAQGRKNTTLREK
jgi:hypothetical protein